MKHLIDECLSPELVQLSIDRGYAESAHVARRGMAGSRDWELLPVILEGDWTFVTKNSVDFRGPKTKPGSKGQFAGIELHAGLICLNGPEGMDLDLQVELFEVALDELNEDPDLVNKVLEISLSEDGAEIEISRYPLPAEKS